jgi:hypothetical protein
MGVRHFLESGAAKDMILHLFPPSGRTSRIIDISTQKVRLFSCGQTYWLLRFVLADIHSLLISSSRVGYLSNNAVGPGRQRCSRLGFTPSSPLRSRQKPRSARYDGTPSTMVGLVLTYILQHEDYHENVLEVASRSSETSTVKIKPSDKTSCGFPPY